ncbi:MAG: hypothetical protein NZN28_03525 [Meiothermus sp.]|uniref:hypothetical protein n=1 Tax=Meiothermus sp. TaxID=1955249 RepID=UPI0025D22323|nr:hypothetical protein [Meiothermus sp.]MCS7067695.1 hypothetical protein [Meiothermus sp.]
MRVGVIDGWLSERYLPFWEPYLRALEVEVVHPAETLLELPFPEPIGRLLSQVYSLKNQGVDYLLLPDVQLGQEAQKGNPSPWLVSLDATLEELVPGRPPALVVPAECSPEVAGLAAQIGQNLTRNPMLARRALERTKRLLSPSFTAPKQAGTRLVGLVAQPMLLSDAAWLQKLRAGLAEHGLSLFLADKAPAELRQEGAYLELGLELPTDLEVAGMHRYLSRLGKVRGLLYVHHADYLPLPAPLRRLLRKAPPPKPWRSTGLEASWGQVAALLAQDL